MQGKHSLLDKQGAETEEKQNKADMYA